MRGDLSSLAGALAFSLAFFWTAPASGQEAAPEARWYRVELLVFSNPADNGGEVWPPTPPLAYPEDFRFLVDPDRLESNLEALLEARRVDESLAADAGLEEWPQAESDVDAKGIQTITLLLPPDPEAELEDAVDSANSTETVEQPAPADETGAPASDASASPVEGLVNAIEDAAPGADDEILPPPRPSPFILLPQEQLEFAGAARQMQRRSNRRVLFHEAWLQPVAERESAIPIVIDRSGDSQDWPELQGSLLLYVSRFLHVESNLWLNTPGSYLPAVWSMAPPPLGPESLRVVEPELAESDLVDATSALPWYEQAARGDDGSLSTLSETEAAAVSQNGLTPAEVDATEEDMTIAEEALGPVYPWRHAVYLDERRRMRSNEVHYLDHPLIGLIIKLTPIEPEELDLLGMAELAEKAEEDAGNGALINSLPSEVGAQQGL
ncbi:MAG: CsiV family protein [Pseudomonadota bacterium]